MRSFRQLGLSIIAAIVAFFKDAERFGFGLDRPILLLTRLSVERLWDVTIFLLTFLFLALPLAILLTKGILDLGQLSMPVWIAAIRTAVLAPGVNALCLLLAVPLASWSREVIGILAISTSSMAL